MSANTLTDGAAARYANALFELSLENDQLSSVESGLDRILEIYRQNADFKKVTKSAIFSRAEQIRALRSVGKKIKTPDLLLSTLCLMASKRRLFAIEEMAEEFKRLSALRRAELTVHVKSASKLNKKQENKIREIFEKATKNTVILNVMEDESLIGGLVIKVGSSLIDSSIKSQLISLENIMKEVSL